VLHPDEIMPTMSCFPMLGVGDGGHYSFPMTVLLLTPFLSVVMQRFVGQLRYLELLFSPPRLHRWTV
jgi:hypothetical protein